MNIYRQGDILIIEALDGTAPEGKPVVKNGKSVLAEGEATGHFHEMTAETTQLYGVDTDERRWLVVEEETELTHPEHNTINIAPGTYWVVYQREYAPQEIRRVLD